MFTEIDVKHDQEITLGEFESYFQSHKNSAAYLDSMEISTKDVYALFRILDTNQEGTISQEEFVQGCLYFKGFAKAMHIASLQREVNSLRSFLDHRLSEL